MDDALLVRGVEGVGDLRGDRQGLLRAQDPGDPVVSVSPSTSSSTSAWSPPSSADPVNRGDVRVVERGEQPRLAVESAQPVGIAAEERGEDLDGDVASELQVSRAIDLAHAAGAEELDQSIAAQVAAGEVRHCVRDGYYSGFAFSLASFSLMNARISSAMPRSLVHCSLYSVTGKRPSP